MTDDLEKWQSAAVKLLEQVEAAEADNARLRSLVGKAYDEGYTDGFSTPVKNPRGDFKCSMAFAALNTGKYQP